MMAKWTCGLWELHALNLVSDVCSSLTLRLMLMAYSRVSFQVTLGDIVKYIWTRLIMDLDLLLVHFFFIFSVCPIWWTKLATLAFYCTLNTQYRIILNDTKHHTCMLCTCVCFYLVLCWSVCQFCCLLCLSILLWPVAA